MTVWYFMVSISLVL